jgi:hypothetical protein
MPDIWRSMLANENEQSASILLRGVSEINVRFFRSRFHTLAMPWLNDTRFGGRV